MSVGGPPAPPTELVEVLERARAMGFLGPGPVAGHLQHAHAFVEALAGVTGAVADLGSGGGVPGLAIAWARPDLHLVLIDAGARRTAFLRDAVAALGWTPRIDVVEGRAEDVARGPWRGACAAVVARAFGPPAVVAECAAPLLGLHGRLVVSEPPDAPDRWPAGPLAELGLQPLVRGTGRVQIQVLERSGPCPERFPRRVGIPAKRPLF